jgi:hypothetical protein
MADDEESSNNQQGSALKRRNPAVQRKLKLVSPANDRRVRLVGTVSRKVGNGAIVLDDGTGKTEVFFDNLDVIEAVEKEYKEGDYVLVTGLVVPREGASFDISGEIIRKQEKTSLPQDLIKRAEALLS